MERSVAVIEKIEGSMLTMSELSLVLKACHVKEKQLGGEIATEGKVIVFAVSCRRLNVVLLVAHAPGVRVPIDGH